MAASTPDFVEIDGNPRPEGLTGGWLRLRDGKRLRYALAKPERAARGTVLLLAGRNETIEKYFETIGDLTSRGFAVATFDWRGQGGSDRQIRDASRGYIDGIETYVRDLETFIETVLVPECRAPYVILAHSMGGLVALAAVPKLVRRFERMVLSAPLVGVGPGAPGRGPLALTVAIMRWIGLGRVPIRRVERSGGTQTLANNTLTSDPVRAERNRRLVEAAPHLFVRSLTARWLHACFQEMRRLDDSDVIATLHLPTLFVTAGADRVVDSPRAERLAWRMRSGHVLSIPHARHELLQERDEIREQFLAAFEGFVASVTPIAPPAGSEEAVLRDLETLKEQVAENAAAALNG